MSHSRIRVLSTTLAVGILCISFSAATKVQQMNLQDLVARADKIFRCTVVDVEPGQVEVGGGVIRTTLYRVRVDEAIKGDFGDRGVPLQEIQMVGSLKKETADGDVRRFPLFDDVPRLTIGEEYLLFLTAPSRIGLSTTVGLAQGCFKVHPVDKQPHVVNGIDNYGLFRGMDRGQIPVSGPIPYGQLKSRVLTLMGR